MMNTLSLLKGLRFVDSFFPSGGYAFSSGLEAAVQGGAVRNAEELSLYVVESLTTGIGEREAVAVGLAHDACVSGTLEIAFKADRELEAMKLDRESRTASRQMGRQVIRLAANQQASRLRKNDFGTLKFQRSARVEQREYATQDAQKVCPARPQQAKRRGVLCSVRGASERSENAAGGLFQHPARHLLIEDYLAAVEAERTPGHLAVSFGLTLAAAGWSKEDSIAAFLYQTATGFVAAAMKLMPIGQREGQRLLESWLGVIERVSHKAAHQRVLQSWSPVQDIYAMRHGRLESRLFRS